MNLQPQVTMVVPHDNRPQTPEGWDHVAELRVFRATAEHWERLIGWRGEMRKKGWKLLRVSSSTDGMVAIFGRTRQELLAKGNRP